METFEVQKELFGQFADDKKVGHSVESQLTVEEDFETAIESQAVIEELQQYLGDSDKKSSQDSEQHDDSTASFASWAFNLTDSRHLAKAKEGTANAESSKPLGSALKSSQSTI